MSARRKCAVVLTSSSYCTTTPFGWNKHVFDIQSGHLSEVKVLPRRDVEQETTDVRMTSARCPHDLSRASSLWASLMFLLSSGTSI